MRSFALLLALFLLFALGFGIMTGVPAESGGRLVAGWLFFLGRTFSRATVNWSGVATIALCGALLLVSGHRFAVWLNAAMHAQTPPAEDGAEAGKQSRLAVSGRWPLRRTALLLTIVVLMFVAGISFIGLVHQIGWLATTPEPLADYRLDLGRYSTTRERHLWYVGLGVQSWHDVYRRRPVNGPWPEIQQASHSWQTRLLPFINVLNDNIDFKIDWDDPKNAPAFRRFVPHYLTPDFGVLREGRGYAVSHYAGNERFFAQPVSLETVKNAGNRLIICGEVSHDFMAWGDPANLRNPSHGLNRSGGGFGSADERGVNFLMADGSTRYITNDVDPRVLAALASPEPHDLTSRCAPDAAAMTSHSNKTGR